MFIVLYTASLLYFLTNVCVCVSMFNVSSIPSIRYFRFTIPTKSTARAPLIPNRRILKISCKFNAKWCNKNRLIEFYCAQHIIYSSKSLFKIEIFEIFPPKRRRRYKKNNNESKQANNKEILKGNELITVDGNKTYYDNRLGVLLFAKVTWISRVTEFA